MRVRNAKAGGTLCFAHEQWRLKTGEAVPLTLTFDGQQPFNVHGIPIADKLVRVLMPANFSLIAQFRRAKAMTAYAPSVNSHRGHVRSAHSRCPS